MILFYTAIKHYKNLQTLAENNLISSDKLCLFQISFESLRNTGIINFYRRLSTLLERDSHKSSVRYCHKGLQMIQFFLLNVTDTLQQLLMGKKD